ncbi:hypothetical protein CsSME_00004094 [Camellia sinensis var. sinensis]
MVCTEGTEIRAVKGRTKLAIVRSTLRLSIAMLTSVILKSDHGKTITLGLSSEGVLKDKHYLSRMRTLHGGVRVLLGLCHAEPIKAHNITYGEASERYPAHTRRLRRRLEEHEFDQQNYTRRKKKST